MPQVPGLDNNTPTLSQNVPGVQLPYRGEFGREGQAYEKLGAELNQAAQTGSQIYDGIQQQHDISTAQKNFVNQKREDDQKIQDLSNTSPDGFVHDDYGVVKNSDGSARTIGQEYWEWADGNYQSRQDQMSPRAAAMFRESMLPQMGQNAQKLQGIQLNLQRKDSENTATDMKESAAKSFDVLPVPTDTPGYYESPDVGGGIKQYPSAQKLYDALHDQQLYRQRQGPSSGRAGLYNPTEVDILQKSDASELADKWLTSAKLDIMESQGSRAALHQSLKDGSSTALSQVHNLLDIVEGKDPQSIKRASATTETGLPPLPTVNSSLTADQVTKWRAELLGMIPAAKEVDKSEYELQKQQLGDYAKGVKNLDQFTGSPLFQKTMMAGSGLGMTPAERVKDLAPSFSSAILSSTLSTTTGVNSPEAKRQTVANVLADAQKRWPQFSQMLGEKNTEGFGEAMTAEVSKQAAAKLQEDEHQMRADPVKYMAGIQEGPQGPGGAPKYRNKMAHDIENALDPQVNPSLFSIFKPMSNGKSAMENAQLTANNGYAKMFGSKADVSILQKEQFEDQAKRLQNSNDPHLVTNYFQQLDKQNMTAAQKENYIQDLVHKGGLPQTYVDALNLKTPAEREARWADLRSGPPPMPEGLNDKQVEQFSQENNKSLYSFLDRKYGPNSPEGRTARNTYDKSWQSDFKQGVGRGMSESDAKDYANGQRDKTTGAIGIVGAQHDFFGTGLMHWGTVGPQVPVEFGSNKYTEDQQQNIRDTLLHFQSKDTLAQYKFVQPPGALPPNENAPSDAENMASRASMWRRVGGGWRLQAQQLDKENRPTGISQDVQIYGHDGKPHYLEVGEDAALAGPPKGSAPSVGPAKPKQPTINMGPPKL